ncbi:MAG: AAA family ATPase [Bacteroidales bacterium]
MKARHSFLLKDISVLQKNKGRVIVGIDGFGGSGKTTLSRNLAKTLKSLGIASQVVHLDDFIFEKRIRYTKNKPQWYSFYFKQWNFHTLIDHIIKPFLEVSQKKIRLQTYDKFNNNYRNTSINLTDKHVLILEGVFVQRKKLSSFLDYTIFINSSKKTRIKRILKRDRYIGNSKQIIKKYIDRYFPAEEYYSKEIKPRSKANIIL